jgi:transcriptional regulator with GAF, ATPase, and Fis domain
MNKHNKKYDAYGGRGIIMCLSWQTSFAQFYADMGECPPGMSLDRIENEGNYEPGNCRWATHEQQNNNRRNTVSAIVDGKHTALAEAARKAGLNYATLRRRVRKMGLSMEEAISAPLYYDRRK